MHHIGCVVALNLPWGRVQIIKKAWRYAHRLKIRRDAREAEGARLEIVYPANTGIEGSNPSLSAIYIINVNNCGLRDENPPAEAG